IKNNDSADDVKNIDLTRIHYLTGPFHIETAEPGDILLVEIQDIQPFQDQPWGFTGIFDRRNGGGFLDDLYPQAYVHSLLSTFPCHFQNPLKEIIHLSPVPKRSGTLRASSVPRGTSHMCASLVSSTLASSGAHPRRK